MTLPTCVATVPIFQDLEADVQAEIAERLIHRRLQAGETLAMPGDEGALRVVRSGRLRQSRITESGNEQLLRVLAHGDFSGEAAVLTGSPEEVYSVAITDAEVCVLAARDLQPILAQHPSVSISMLAQLAERLASTEEQLAQITGRSAAARLGEYLAGLVADRPAGQPIALPMSKKDLASFLGTTPETLSRRLRAFEDDGLIAQGPGNTVTVKEPSRLMQLDS